MPILKMLSRRKLSAISHTLEYIMREEARGASQAILHNLRSSLDDQESIAREYMANEAYRKVTSNRVYFYHSILSLSESDQKNVTSDTMQAIARKYFELRGDILGVAVPHFDTDSPHLHILESATYYRENRASGLRKKELHELKLELEKFVREQFPELRHSLVLHGAGKEYVKELEYQLLKRAGTSEREQLKRLVREAQHNSTSRQQFLATLLDAGFPHYERNSDGTPTGVVSESGRKYRFKTLGVSPEQILALENVHERLQEYSLLEQLQHIRQKNNSKTREK